MICHSHITNCLYLLSVHLVSRSSSQKVSCLRFRRGILRNGYHIQGRQQTHKLPNPENRICFRFADLTRIFLGSSVCQTTVSSLQSPTCYNLNHSSASLDDPWLQTREHDFLATPGSPESSQTSISHQRQET